MKFEGPDNEWLVIEAIRIPAAVPLSFTKAKERIYVLPGGLRVTPSWIEKNKKKVVHAFKTH